MKVHIVDLDTYQSFASPLDQLFSSVNRVPIIRVYGSVNDNEGKPYNVLVHVHNYYPYVFVDCFEDNPNIPELINTLETALSLYKARKATDEDERFELENLTDQEEVSPDSSTKNKRSYIASVSLCKGTPCYGYNVGFKPVYKISLLSGQYKARLAKLLQDGKIHFSSKDDESRIRRNVYESHLPYLLQFLTDYNLFGCSWMEFDDCYWRFPIINKHFSNANSKRQLIDYLQSYIKPNNVLLNTKFPRVSHSILEMDIVTDYILNRNSVQERNFHLNLAAENSIDAPTNYISSLSHLLDDLKFQSNLKNIPFNPTRLDSENKTKCSWSNQEDLDELFNYVVGSKCNINQSQFDEMIKDGINFPTIFEMVDIERKNLNHKNIPLDSFILKWSNYLELFSENEQSDFVFPPSTKLTDMSYSMEMQNNTNTKIEIDFHGSNMSETDHFSSDEEADDLMSDINVEVPYSQVDEMFLSEMTQRPKTQIMYKQPDELQLQSQCKLSIKLLSPNSFVSIMPKEIFKENIMNTFVDLGLPEIMYTDPFYDNEKDMPDKPMILADKKIPILLMKPNTFMDFEIRGLKMSRQIFEEVQRIERETNSRKKLFKKHKRSQSVSTWIYLNPPPRKDDIVRWVKENQNSTRQAKDKSQIERVTVSNNYKGTYRSQKVDRNPNDFPKLTNLQLELFCDAHNNQLSNPREDPILVIFYHFDDSNLVFDNYEDTSGALVFIDPSDNRINVDFHKSLPNVEVFHDEHEMVGKLIELVRLFDPDILSGYEINSSSWGYLIERFRFAFDINLLAELSRCFHKCNGKFGDRWGYTHTSVITINGRHMINIWRFLKSEINLTDYSLESVAYHILHLTIPRYTHKQLIEWFQGNFKGVQAFYNYLQTRLQISNKILSVQEIILRNVEQSRLIGIDFYSNYYRGSQYKIESILARISKSENYLLNSPSKQDVHEMRSLECIPLVMEPDSNFYKSPLVVLDFQSLYPSIMIAFNYCYSTLLGKLKGYNPKKNPVGYLEHHQLPKYLLSLLKDDITLSPNGYMFVNANVRKSLLSKMLEEILAARVDVKNIMKASTDDPELTGLYNSRQMALKLFANVTYGYTSASFSGRMPNSDVADAIVSTAREILIQSIDLIESNQDWGAKVVYGDTDSLFVYLPGKARSKAFKIGAEIAKFVTTQFPDPIKLKFEKVYHPCILLSKKRYVGNSFEYDGQVVPKFDAKGIETIRRDGIPAQGAMVHKCLKILFETQNLSKIKKYVIEQFIKIVNNKVSIRDFCFAKEVRYGTYKDERYLPPGAVVARRKIESDPRSEPQYKERVPYIVIQDSSKLRVRDRCVSPEEFIASFDSEKNFRLDYEYYITRVLIPPLERLFNLIGVDIKQWYREVPRVLRMDTRNAFGGFVYSNSCIICGQKRVDHYKSLVCKDCSNNEQKSVAIIQSQICENIKEINRVDSICAQCSISTCGLNASAACENFSCSNYFSKLRCREKNEVVIRNRDILNDW